jgi:hypothetical protein
VALTKNRACNQLISQVVLVDAAGIEPGGAAELSIQTEEISVNRFGVTVIPVTLIPGTSPP